MEGAGEPDVAMADKKRARDGVEDVSAAVTPIAESGEVTIVSDGETLERLETKRVRIEQEEITDGLLGAVAVSRTEVEVTTIAAAEPMTTDSEGVEIVNITAEIIENGKVGSGRAFYRLSHSRGFRVVHFFVCWLLPERAFPVQCICRRMMGLMSKLKRQKLLLGVQNRLHQSASYYC